MPLRPLTRLESLQLTLIASQVRATIDADLADLIDQVAAGNDSVLPRVYDRLAAVGRLDAADRLRRLMTGE